MRYPERLRTGVIVRLVGAERIDGIAELVYGDPAQWYKLAELNGTTDPTGLPNRFSLAVTEVTE